jgi:predicted Zn-dependent protease
MGSYEEALPHLERIERERPGDADVQVRLARCHNILGRPEQARSLLDAVLQEHPDHGLALRTRGQFALADQQPDRAEGWLRQAAKLQPEDYQTQWLLFRALQQQSKEAEAKVQRQRAEQIKDRAERMGELTSRRLTEQPLDPALHYEMGILLLRSGQHAAGEGWLHSALNLDPNHRPSHSALADHYTRQGDTRRAAEHRSRLEQK